VGIEFKNACEKILLDRLFHIVKERLAFDFEGGVFISVRERNSSVAYWWVGNLLHCGTTQAACLSFSLSPANSESERDTVCEFAAAFSFHFAKLNTNI